MLTDIRQKLVVDYMYLAERIAFKKKRSVPPQVSVEELKAAAYLGLVDAAEKYKEGIGNFPTYAYYRISGAIIDYLRELGWGKSNNRKSAVSLDAEVSDEFSIKDTLEARTIRSSDEFFAEISKELPQKATGILKSYYMDGQSLREIAETCHVTESRISQLMSSYRGHIKRRWNKNEFYAEIAA